MNCDNVMVALCQSKPVEENVISRGSHKPPQIVISVFNTLEGSRRVKQVNSLQVTSSLT